MHRWARTSSLSVGGVCIALAMACNHDTEVQRQTRELERAQKEVPEVTAQLESDLTRARGDVAHLEAKLALARQGLTDDVIENQRELEQALKEQQQLVRSELSEAQHEAEVHDRDTTAALKQLQQTATTAAAPPGEPAPGTPPGTMPAPLAPSVTPEPVHPDEVVRVHGQDPDAGAESQMTPPNSPTPSGPAPSVAPAEPAPSVEAPPSSPAPSSPAPAPGPAPSAPN